jgi:hypothetical protein
LRKCEAPRLLLFKNVVAIAENIDAVKDVVADKEVLRPD